MQSSRWMVSVVLAVLAAAVPAVQAQQNPPHAGYAYPAGGRQGDTFRVTVGGQFLERTTNVYLSGRGIQAKIVECIKPLTPKQLNDLRERLEELRKKPKDAEAIKEMMAIRDKLNDFQNKRANPVLADKVVLQLTIAADAELGQRELRLAAPNGLSNPLVFQVGQLTEFRKQEAKPSPRTARRRKTPGPQESRTRHARAGDDHHAAGRGERADHARRGGSLSVPGPQRSAIWWSPSPRGNCGRIWPMPCPAGFRPPWRFAIPQGNELAYSDHYRFHPDPVLYCKIPKNGQYVLEIRRRAVPRPRRFRLSRCPGRVAVRDEHFSRWAARPASKPPWN